MFAPIPVTKLSFPPPRRDLVHRPRLIERLAAGLQGRLTLISASPGSGKSTLISEWLSQAGRAAAWLSIDASDNDPIRFLECLVAALGTAEPGLADGTATLLRLSQPILPQSIFDSLVNDLSAGAGDSPNGIVLVLDDYHLITSPAIHDALEYLLAHLPRSCHMVILAREDPPLPLPRLRVQGEMMELRDADLRFTVEEAAAFLTQTMRLNLTEADIVSLAERTEGWIAALQIAGLALQNRDRVGEFITTFRGDDRYIMDYLMDEVFRRQPVQIQDFLLETSILARLCAPLCDDVTRLKESASQPINESRTSFADSQAILEHLERANLFVVSLDNRREWYRYHYLFADLLRYRLQRTCPERLPELHGRACRWYAQAGDADEAMQHALAIPDPFLAAGLAERYMLSMIGSSRIATYLGWVQRLPDELIARRPYLCAGCGWASVLINQAEAAERYAAWGEAALSQYELVTSLPEGRRITESEVAGNLMAIRSYAARLQGDVPGAIEHARQALATLPADADSTRCAVALNLGFLHQEGGKREAARDAFCEAFEAARRSGTNVYVAITALGQMGSISAMRGKLREAEDFFHRAVRYGTDEAGLPPSTPGIGTMHGWLMWLHCQRNEISEAQAHLDRVLQAAGQTSPETTIRAYLYQARIAHYRGETAFAESCFARVEELARGHPLQGLIQAEWVSFRGDHYLRQGDSASAVALLEAHGFEDSDLDQQPAYGLAPRLAGYMLLARVLAMQGAHQRADSLLERLCLIAEAIPNVEVLLQALALRAVVAGSVRGDVARGLPSLRRALDLAAAEGFARPILEAGGALARPLRQAIMQGIQPAFAHKLLVDLAEDERRRAVQDRAPASHIAPDAPRLIEMPTEREVQVLRLLAAGLSSNEVADQLVISVSTARSYIKSVYGKLGAHGRAEAIEKGRQFGLI